MRVLMLNYEYPPLGGGAGNATRWLLEEFGRRDDVAVDLVTTSTGRARIDEVASNIRIHFVDIGKDERLHFQSNRDLLAYSWHARRVVRTLLGANVYACCHAFFGIPCGYLAMHTGLPYVVSLRGSDVPSYNPRFAVADALVFRRLSRRIWKKAAAVVANSAGLRELALRSAPRQGIGVIPNGVDTVRFHPAVACAHAMALLCVARLIPRKGIEDIIHALALLPDASLTVVGTGPAESELRALATRLGVGDRVRWLGQVDHAGLPPIYREASVFVLPSRNEGMSNTVLEALASGLPVLLTATGGTEELLREGENGFTIRAGHPEDIATRIAHYAAHPDERVRHGNASRALAETMSWRAVADAYVHVYRRIAGAA